MKTIYASCACSKKNFEELFKQSKQIPGQQVQKYHRLIMEGMSINGVKVKTITGLPVSHSNSKKKCFNIKSDNENGVEYNYMPIINIRGIKNILVVIGSFYKTIKYMKNDRDTYLICDVLNFSVSMGALFAAKLLGRKNIGIVTDIPAFLSEGSANFKVKLNNLLIKQFDSYIFLTNDMNSLINKRKRPYIVIEGQVDISMRNIENDIGKKYKHKVCIYAGMVHKIYGIKYLVEGFIKANIIGAELHIYGSGDYRDELIEICKNHANVKYFGVVANDIVVKEELKATLLINPRPTNEAYTKYSFPSKNMEYMVSGTPVLTTKLPGMPKEYDDYVYLLEEENVDGIKERLVEILAKSDYALHEKGEQAKAFVLKEKNNIVQSKKIINLFQQQNSSLL